MGIFTKADGLIQLPVEDISPSPHQPRRYFDPAAMAELSQSLAVHGMIQPLVVRRKGDQWLLIAGERRLRAAKTAGLKMVPCYAITRSEDECSLLSLLENMQRQDLNFYEEAKALEALLERQSMTQSKLAVLLGKSQAAIANKLRILSLPQEELEALVAADATERHARALLSLEDEGKRREIISRIAKEHLTVAKTEQLVAQYLLDRPKPIRRGVVRDVRLFFNTVDRAVSMMKEGGLPVSVRRQDGDDAITLTIVVPRGKSFSLESKSS